MWLEQGWGDLGMIEHDLTAGTEAAQVTEVQVLGLALALRVAVERPPVYGEDNEESEAYCK